eukprot:1285454-Prymnesium_polylepis.1
MSLVCTGAATSDRLCTVARAGPGGAASRGLAGVELSRPRETREKRAAGDFRIMRVYLFHVTVVSHVSLYSILTRHTAVCVWPVREPPGRFVPVVGGARPGHDPRACSRGAERCAAVVHAAQQAGGGPGVVSPLCRLHRAPLLSALAA